MFDLVETFEAAGVCRLVRDFFGEPPMLLARKGTLRRISHEGTSGGWHQDGAFMGVDIRSLNVWLALTHCGDTAPGLDIVGRRLTDLVPTGDGAFAPWAANPDAAEQTAAGDLVRPIFDAGDTLIFDHLNLHRTTIDPGMDRDRYTIETWLFSPSTTRRWRPPSRTATHRTTRYRSSSDATLRQTVDGSRGFSSRSLMSRCTNAYSSTSIALSSAIRARNDSSTSIGLVRFTCVVPPRRQP